MNLPFISRILLIVGLSIYFLAAMIAFQVRENEKVVLTRFGQPVEVINDPGLYVKWPWPIESINRLDARLNFYEIRLSEALTRDRRNVIVPVYVAWKIDDPLKFVEAIGSADNARTKIESLVSSAKNTILGTYDFKQLVSDTPDSPIKIPEIESRLTETTAQQARDNFGIQICQVGVERISLPEVNTSFVFERMRAERSQFAERYLAEGRQQADALRADVDAQKTVILAEAQRDSEIKRGQAEAEAAQIYSQAHRQDPDFYLYLRKLETLRKTINQNTTLVLDANQAPFDLLKSSETSGADHDAPQK
jgi:membrane protease subunit HflC